MYYYFDDIINGTDINFSDILLDKKLYENISYLNYMVLDSKIEYLVLFDYGLLDKTCNKINYLVSN